MSFPNRYGVSPASFPRDFGLLQGPASLQRAARAEGPHDDELVSEHASEASDETGRRAGQDEGQADSVDSRPSMNRRSSSATSLSAAENSLSALLLRSDDESSFSIQSPSINVAPAGPSRGDSLPSAPRRYSGQTTRSSASRPQVRSPGLGRSRDANGHLGYGAVDLAPPSPAGASARTEVLASPEMLPQSVGPIPARLFLGGDPIPPPPDADLSVDWAREDELTPTVGDAARPRWLGSPEPTPRLYAPDKQPRWPEAARPPPAESPGGPPETAREGETEGSPLLRAHRLEAGEMAGNARAGVMGAGRGRRLSWTSPAQEPLPPTNEEVLERVHDKDLANPHRHEAWILTKSSAPIFVTHLLEFSLNIVSVFSLGHLGTTELAAAALASMTANLTGYSLLNGFVSALDTILPSSYAAHPKSCGLWTQRMLVLLAVLLTPVLIIWQYSYLILRALGQEEDVAHLASTYLRYLSFGLVPYACFEVQRRYLQAQGLFHASTVVLVVVSPLNAILNVYLVHLAPESIRLGFIGAPVASSVASWVMFALMTVQCWLAPRIAWGGWTRSAFKELGILVRLGLAGVAQVCSEWCAWEIVGLITSKLGTTNLAAQSVLLTSSSISYQLPYSLSVAASVRVSSALGAQLPQQAKLSSDLSVAGSVVLGLVNSSLFLIFRREIGMLFARDAAVIDAVAKVIPLVAAFQIADGLCGVAGGVLRGMGRQSEAAFVNVSAYYVIGLPLGIALTFSRLQLGLGGLWAGLTVALVYGALGSVLLVQRTDWEAQVSHMARRMGMRKADEEAVAAASAIVVRAEADAQAEDAQAVGARNPTTQQSQRRRRD